MAKIGNLKVQYRAVASLRPLARNPRAHPPEQIDALKRSIERFGFYAPILIDSKKGEIVKGNGTFQAALQLDMQRVPVIEVSGLSKAELRALIVADNRLAEKSGWDESVLALELGDLKAMGFDLSLTGFEASEVEELLRPSPSALDAEPPALALPKHAVSRMGDVWVLGEHRLGCGDATNRATVKALMGNARAQCVFTDPPYGVSYEAPSGVFEAIRGDELRRGQLGTLLQHAFAAALEHTRQDAAWYVWHASATREDFAKALRDTGLVELGTIIWVKPGIVLGWSDYRWQHEPCLYCARQGVRPAFYGARTESTVWQLAARRADGGPHAAIGTGLVLTTSSGQELYLSTQVPKGRKVRHVHLEAGGVLLSPAGTEADDVWEVSRDSGHGKKTTTHHPTQKPVELARRALRNSTQTGEIVLDMFAGSASTLIAAEQTGRCARCLELDPRYVDVGVRRWQEFTGKQALHASEKKTFDALAQARAKRAA